MEAKHREHCRTSTAGRLQPPAGAVTNTLSVVDGTWGNKEGVSTAARLGQSPPPVPPGMGQRGGTSGWPCRRLWGWELWPWGR